MLLPKLSTPVPENPAVKDSTMQPADSLSLFERYRLALTRYAADRSEEALYQGSLLSREFLGAGMGPEDIIAVHMETLARLLAHQEAQDQVALIMTAREFLYEVMIAYGMRFQEDQAFRREQELREAAALLAQERQRERERIAMDLHDGVIQHLYGTGFKLSAVDHAGVLPEASRQMLRDAIRGIDTAIQEIRTYIYALQPDPSRRFHDAVQSMALEFGIPERAGFELIVDPEAESAVSPGALIPLLQATREAISNALRHADPSELQVSLRLDGEGGLVLTVVDDGTGMRNLEALPEPGHGLHNIARRAQDLGGAMRLRPHSPRGTELEVRVPAEYRDMS